MSMDRCKNCDNAEWDIDTLCDRCNDLRREAEDKEMQNRIARELDEEVKP